ncbi:MAG: hypothetical protein JST86_19215 [Bacteroidetes bacterium]|nr:hypothetical protein [Bacteroidota bacterium]
MERIYGELTQDIKYPQDSIYKYHIRQATENKLFLYKKSFDSSIFRKIFFDTIGHVIKQEEDFNANNVPRSVLTYEYDMIDNDTGYTEIIKSKKKVANNAIEFTDIKFNPIKVSFNFESNSRNISSIEKIDNVGNTETIKYTYNSYGQIEKKEVFRNKVLKEIITVNYSFY